MEKLLIVVLFMISLPLNAKNNEKDLLSMSLKELLQVKITGSTLTSENLKTVPSAVSVFTQEEIKRMGLDTLGELMNLVPGFQTYRSSGSSMETPFSSRGRRIGVTPAEILVMIDGQRFDSPRSSGNATLAPSYPLKYVEKVEFIRGPGAAVYGSNAMMGIINIITTSDVNEISISYGSFRRRQVYLQTSQKLSDFKVDVAAHIEEDDGENYNVQDTYSINRIDTDDPRKIENINVKFSWASTQLNIKHDHLKVKNFYELNTLSNDVNSRNANISSISLKHIFDWKAVDSYYWLSINHVDATVVSQLTAPGDLSPVSNPSSNDALILNVNFNDYKEVRTQLHNDWEINNDISLQFGMEFRYIDAPESTAENNFDLADLANNIIPIRYYGNLLSTTPVQAESSRNIIGLYTQYQHNLFEDTNLTLGLRYDDFSNIGAQLSPRLGVVQKVNEHQNIKLLYGEAFRAPSEGELNLLNNPVVLGNQELMPETVRSVDLIWLAQWVRTNISIGYFENRFSDSIVLTDTGGGTLQYQNISQDPTKGIEFEITQEFNDHWLFRATYTHLSEKPDLSFREADNLSSLMINYQKTNWNINLIAAYSGKREMATGNDDSNRIDLDDYWQVFTKLFYNFNANLTGFIQAKNLLDNDYETPPANSALNEGIPGRGREWLIGIGWEY